MHFKKTGNIVGIFANSRLVTFYCLATHFRYGLNVRRFAVFKDFLSYKF